MAYVGNQPTQAAFVTDTFSGNGSTTAFTMSVAPANTASVLVAVTGVLQDPSTYSVSGTTLTFSAAPPSGTGNINVRYLGIPASGVTTTAYRTVTEFTATAGQTTFTPPSYTPGFINVYRNGVRLGTANYTATNGTTVVLGAGAIANDLVVIESFLVSSVLNAIPATAGAVGTTYLTDASVTAAKLASGAARTNFGAGAVLQVVNGYNSGRVRTNATSYTSLATSPNITPSSSTSKILVMCNTSIFRDGANGNAYFAMYRNGSTSLIGSGSVENAGWWNDYSAYTYGQWAFIQLDSPATTSATNYQLMGKSDGSTIYAGISGRGLDTDHQNGVTWTLMEIAA